MTYAQYIADEHFDALAAMEPWAREAEIFARSLAEVPLTMRQGDLLAGRYDWGRLPDGTPRSFAKIPVITPEDAEMNALLRAHQINAYYGRGHTCIDYGRILREGLDGYAEEVRRAAAKPGANAAIYAAMLAAIDAVGAYAARLAELARRAAPENERMHCTLAQVPMHPARDFFEAVQSIWIMHTAVPFSDKSWASISLGRMDQYLLPYYRKSLADGVPREEMKAYLKALWHLLDAYGDGACALNIGGMDADGHDSMNELSWLIIEVQKELRLRAPILAARIHPATPAEVLDSLVDPALFCVGQPTFYGELPCRRAMEYRGLAPEIAREFSVNSCMGLVIAGEEIADMWGCMMNMHLPLEMAVNGGEPIHRPFPGIVREVGEPTDLDALLRLYGGYLRQLLSRALAYNRKCAESMAANEPNPMLSALTKGCIARGLDRAVGAEYQTVTVEAMAMINTGNAIAAINTLVFREKKYTLADFVDGARRNWEGCDALRADILRCGRYAAGSDHADSICARLAAIMAEACTERNFDHTLYLPSLHTLDAHVGYGAALPATFDGRTMGTPVSKNAGAADTDRGKSPTALVISAAALGQERFSGGQPIDVFFDHTMFSDDAKREKIKSLITTYFALGGLQFQVNSGDPAMLRRAYDDPDAHRDLIVRRGGYSVRFVELPRKIQAEFIAAAEGR